MPLSSGSGMAPGPEGMSGWCTLSGMRGVLPASCAVCLSEHTRRHPDGDHTARPRHSQPTWRPTFTDGLMFGPDRDALPPAKADGKAIKQAALPSRGCLSGDARTGNVLHDPATQQRCGEFNLRVNRHKDEHAGVSHHHTTAAAADWYSVFYAPWFPLVTELNSVVQLSYTARSASAL